MDKVTENRSVQNPTSRVASSDPEQVAAASFVEFYRARFVPMVRLAVAITGSEVAAEDIVHDAFLRVHARWRDVESPNAYLRVVVVNGCRSAADGVPEDFHQSTSTPRDIDAAVSEIIQGFHDAFDGGTPSKVRIAAVQEGAAIEPLRLQVRQFALARGYTEAQLAAPRSRCPTCHSSTGRTRS